MLISNIVIYLAVYGVKRRTCTDLTIIKLFLCLSPSLLHLWFYTLVGLNKCLVDTSMWQPDPGENRENHRAKLRHIFLLYSRESN